MRKPHKFKMYDFGFRAVTHSLQFVFVCLVGKLLYDVNYWRKHQLPERRLEAKRLLEEQMAEKQAAEAAMLSKLESLQEEAKNVK